MLRVGPFLFKQAETDEELDQIHRLNFRTFVNEIHQYSDPGSGDCLVDKFHDKNVYFVGLKRGRVKGMLSAHDQPPFSIADRLQDPSVIQRPGMHVMEVRLLAVEPNQRHTSLFAGLAYVLFAYALKKEKTHLVISGVAENLRLYKRIGFVPMGEGVSCGEATFVPMILDVRDIPKKMERMVNLWESHVENQMRTDKSEWAPGRNGASKASESYDVSSEALNGGSICLLPGPVPVTNAVREAFHQAPIYHRSPEFIARFAEVRQTLGKLVGGRRVAILNGSGTLANETVAATLAAIRWRGRGLLLVNGEFGNRLQRQAVRFGLHPRVIKWQWGEPWNLDEIDEALAEESCGWVWGVHQESSTGVLNDLPGLVQIAKRYNVEVCADCVSSLGAVPLDLQEVFLATGTSGKSLGSYAGAAIVFAAPKVLDVVNPMTVPSYFDLRAALSKDGPNYTFPSSTLLALEAALSVYSTPTSANAVYARYSELGQYVRSQLREIGLKPLGTEEYASPVVTTFAPPDGVTSAELVQQCLGWGISIGGQSGYLAEQSLVQIAIMGNVTQQMCDVLFERMAEAYQPALADF